VIITMHFAPSSKATPGVGSVVMPSWSDVPTLTRPRVRSAYAVAVVTDALQFVLGPFGWAFADEILDVAAAVCLWRLLGFHPLLLPTFAIEFLPVSDLLPLWTGCVALVVASRQRQQSPSAPPPPSNGPIIDV
jgi:hypothetical protein